ncbi:hypothetical protein Cst_c11610 [Thermoclostridium stercorarium subsp. stercorarium DSM 8532]|jgi:uncharacterized membrane protein|uniref:ECF transporter S component n=3 Tax=Thermoclostridium stercorarium TaxID=1510 RepID=L7VN43_THES1|nr:ECF transporter S component [Thermoclostridium stercorarium]AGC68157.1 hypothetical protein Cst_c11610 [Thermoclostridium stercorarium subsp. stercorarium DSM 8532]AGI39183.1 membrane protein [Thermoclostridium stercorarium subsp. stercorarium DSM 8532]ANW98530.1 hypothetical protein CSTERTH_05505 [Thermoclostridium stercorarium subsp. thermolacticum DSM 2910]ANX01065.1 hypothetical protein CSTERLE_05460 [Thermoclostridium stercorarium subsp. leptospartum DSM 9219]UZQ86682.1 ECF transporter
MNNENAKSMFTVRKIAVTGVLSALSIVLNFTPLGYIYLPGLAVQITTMHLPVIIGAILEGPVAGAFIGLIFGLSSFYTAATSPLPIAFAFLNPLVSIVPRILIGVVAYYVYHAMDRILGDRRTAISIGTSAVLATTTNTVGVLGTIYLFYAKRYIEAMISMLGLPETTSPSYIFISAVPNYIAELIASVVICIPVVLAIRKIRN